MKRKKVIFWDWHGTLVQSTPTFRHHFVHVVGEFMGRWDPIRGKEHEVLEAYEATWKTMRKKRQTDCLKLVLKNYSFEADDSFIRAFFTRLNEKRRNEPMLHKDAQKTLQALSKTYRMGVISNGKGEGLKQSGIDQWLPAENWFTSHSVGSRKPHPKLFKAALKAMGVSPSQAVMVGNSWKNDIQGAAACGMDAIWIRPKHKKTISRKKVGKRNVYIVRSLRDVPRLFNRSI